MNKYLTKRHLLWAAFLWFFLFLGALYVIRTHAAPPNLASIKMDFSSPYCNPAPNGSNPCPTTLTRPTTHPLSAMAQLGKELFSDPLLSGSGKLSCASCHTPTNHYSPDAHAPDFALGGRNQLRHGLRAVPSLSYLERQPPFSIGPDNATSEAPLPSTPPTITTKATSKSTQNKANSALALVPQGGLFWDGRADTLQQQARGPLLNANEMAATIPLLLHRLRTAPYAATLRRLAGAAAIERTPQLLLDEALFAIGRYQNEDPAFHPYTSNYDRWLEGQYRFTPAEQRGYLLFNDSKKGNCAACHLSHPEEAGHLPPLFTDFQYEALGAPHNPHAPSETPDLGLCKSGRTETQTASYCGYFKTPSLRNTATRPQFFHNSVFHTLGEVLSFYAQRPARTLDLPAPYAANVDVNDHPFDRATNAPPALSLQEQSDIISFLRTLTDRDEGKE